MSDLIGIIALVCNSLTLDPQGPELFDRNPEVCERSTYRCSLSQIDLPATGAGAKQRILRCLKRQEALESLTY